MSVLESLKEKRYFILLFLLPALIVYAGFMAVPLINSMGLSFMNEEGAFVGLGNYIRLFTESPYNQRIINAFLNNLQFFAYVMVLQNFTGLVIAIMVTRDYKGLYFFRILSFIPTTLSVLVAGFLFQLILNPTWGIIDKILRTVGLEFLIVPWLGNPHTALASISFVVAWQYMGIPILFFATGIDNIDQELLESARVAGANFFQEVRYIILPLLVPIMKIIAILTLVGNFTGFAVVYAMASVRANPGYATDIFGSLFYRATFGSTTVGGWGTNMGAAVAGSMAILILIGIFLFTKIGQWLNPMKT